MFVDNAASHRLVLGTDRPLIVLERHELSLDADLLARARHELLADGPAEGAAPFRAGFLLGLQADARTHPACLALAHALRRELLAPVERALGVAFSLSFLKLAQGRPPAASEGPFHEGPHLDNHPGLTESTELLRLLVNLSPQPRRLVYAASDRWQLAGRGVRIGRREFVPLVLPADVELRQVILPGRTARSVHALKFYASAVPHVGINDRPEQFLASFEALAPAGP